MSDYIQYGAILEGNQFRAEIQPHKNVSPNPRDVVLSIAAQAIHGDVACVTSNKITGYYMKRLDNLITVVIAKPDAPPRILLTFLKKIDEKLTAESGRHGYQDIMDTVFQDVSKKGDSIQIAQGEIDRVKQIMVDNIDRLLERGERVNLLVDRTGEMSQSANIFNRQATHLQRKMWFQNVKVAAIGATLIGGTIFIISKPFW